jgi:hypothetical protein
MNERLAKLTEQCYEYNETMQGAWFNKTKFAELIIEECAKISESVTPRHTECGNKIAAKIRKFDGE